MGALSFYRQNGGRKTIKKKFIVERNYCCGSIELLYVIVERKKKKLPFNVQFILPLFKTFFFIHGPHPNFLMNIWQMLCGFERQSCRVRTR